jgi:hypothetical protein
VALLLDDLRLSGTAALPTAPVRESFTMGVGAAGELLVVGAPGSVAADSQVYLQHLLSGSQFQGQALADGSFQLTVPAAPEHPTSVILNYSILSDGRPVFSPVAPFNNP